MILKLQHAKGHPDRPAITRRAARNRTRRPGRSPVVRIVAGWWLLARLP
jgi:hypothetical protein